MTILLIAVLTYVEDDLTRVDKRSVIITFSVLSVLLGPYLELLAKYFNIFIGRICSLDCFVTYFSSFFFFDLDYLLRASRS